MSLRRTVALAVGTMTLLAACSGSDAAVPVDISTPTGSVPVIVTPTEPDAPEPGSSEAAIEESVETPIVDTGDKDIITRSSAAVGDGVQPEGFTTITARVTSADGDVCEICLWLADGGDETSRGLMGVTDLGGPVGMAFVYDVARDGAFFMFGTPTPLSIAWFSPTGDHVAQTDMEPCLVEDSSVCERYRPGAAYTIAVEMFEGQLAKVGIEPGSSIELLDLPCG